MRTQKSGQLTSLYGMVGGFLLLATTSAQALLIDDFSDAQLLSTTFGPTSSTVAAPSALGGKRDAKITALPPTGALELSVAIGGGGDVLSHSQGSGVTGSSDVQWDGGNGMTIDPTGLGAAGVDLTEGGINDRLRFDVLLDDRPATVTFSIYDVLGGSASKAVALPGGIYDETSYTVFFSSFVGVDMTKVGAIALNISGPLVSTDVTLDDIEATHAPEPGTFLLLGTGLLGIGGYGWRRKRQIAQA